MAICAQGDHSIEVQRRVWLHRPVPELHCLLQVMQVKTGFCPYPCVWEGARRIENNTKLCRY